MRILPVILAATIAATGSAAEQKLAPKPQVFDWCTVLAPGMTVPGAPCEITVTVTKIPEGAKFVTIDLHSRGEGGEYKGFHAHGETKPVVLEVPGTWKMSVKALPGVTEVVPLVYLSTAGDWTSKVLVADAAPIVLQAETAW